MSSNSSNHPNSRGATNETGQQGHARMWMQVGAGWTVLTGAYTAAGPRTMIAPGGRSSSCAWLGRASITATTTSMDSLSVGHLAGGGGLVSASAVRSDEWATRGADLTGLADISCGGNVCVARKTDDTADTVESSLEKAVTHTGSRGRGLVASADPPAVSARAPSRRRASKRRRQQVGESLSRFDPCAEYTESICPHGHMATFCNRGVILYHCTCSDSSAHRRRRGCSDG